jgi:hypothetical protein
VREVDLQLAALRESFEGLVDDRRLLKAGIAAVYDRYFEPAVVASSSSLLATHWRCVQYWYGHGRQCLMSE